MANEKAISTKKEGAQDIKEWISSEGAKKQFAMVLPRHLTPERFVRIAITALTKTPALAKCTPASLASCLIDLSQLGLEPDGRKAHLIPYGDKCTLIVDYKGLVDLVRRSGEVSYIHADVICEKDKFDVNYGTDAKLVHNPSLKERGKIKGAYSFVRFKDGAEDFTVMSIDEIEAIRKRSKAGNSGPWVTDFNEMAKKTVFRRHSKWLPISSEKFQEALEKDMDVPIDITSTKAEIPMPKEINTTATVEAPAPDNREPGAEG